MPGALAQGDTVVPSRLPKELLEKSGFLMVRLGMDFKARALAELEAAGFSQHHYSVLALLGEQARETQLTIADALGLDPSQLVGPETGDGGTTCGLEKRGLIERQGDPKDRRRHVVSLTQDDRQQLVRLRAMINRIEDGLFAPLDAESRQTLHTLLLRLASYHDPRCTEGTSHEPS